eukprot:jgi/Undpi1/6556/HiC_scaffold_20.g09035.m1
MGPKKKWHMHSQPKRSRDDGQQQANGDGQRQQQPGKRPRVSAVNLGNVKGHQAVVGTCDVRNDRQATAELVDLLNVFADELYPEEEQQDEAEGEDTEGALTETAPSAASKGAAPASGTPTPTPTPTAATADAPEKPPLSVEEMIRQEADALRSGTAKSHRFKSVNTSVRGVVMVCVMDAKIDVLKLVDAVFDGIRATRQRRCRFLERMTPMQVTAFSEIDAFKSAAEAMVYDALPQVAEGVPPLDESVAVAPPNKANANAAADAASAGKSGVALLPNKAEAGESPTAAEAGLVTGKTLTPAGASTATEEAPPQQCAAGEEGSGGSSEAAAAVVVAVAAAGGEGNGGRADEVAALKTKKTCDKRWKFRVDVRRRNSGLKRLDLINAVADSVGKGHTVSMSSPDVTIAIEAVKSVVGASVLFNYALNHEYSISRLQDAVCGAILSD